ncbi:MAG: dTDP-4-dehydrorhamnose 3,5-epimerase family protein [Candidatus Paracaedibacter sp.]
MIEGIIRIPLKQIQDERGKVMHMLRSTDPHFEKFGEVYFSWSNPGHIKAWKKHKVSTMNFAVPIGSMNVVVFDDRSESPTYKCIEEFIMGPDNYYLLTIPAELWYGFKAEGNQPAMIVNCTTNPHDPEECIKIDPFDPLIPYFWNVS